MIQLTPPSSPDTVTIHVPLPPTLEHWRDVYLQGLGIKAVVFVGFAILLYLLARVARQRANNHIEDINRRHRIRKWIGYAYTVLLVLTGIGLFSNGLARLGTILALVAAGIAVALQDVLKSVVGWLYISSRAGINVGDRVEVNGVVGDVIDIGVLKTTLLEVGNLVYGPQSTNRVVTVPNYYFLSSNAFSATAGNPFVWQEIKIVVTFESDWAKAEQILRGAADQHHSLIADDMQRGFRAIEQRYAFRSGKLTPIVYVALAEFGIDLTMRFLTHSRRRRDSVDTITRQVLTAFEREPGVELAYPTYRLFRLGEGVPGRVGAAAMHPSELTENQKR